MWPGVVFFDFILFGFAEPLKSVNLCFSSSLVWFEVSLPQTLFCVSISFSHPCWTSVTCVSSLFTFLIAPPPTQGLWGSVDLYFLSLFQLGSLSWSVVEVRDRASSIILLCPLSICLFRHSIFQFYVFLKLISFLNPASLLRMSSSSFFSGVFTFILWSIAMYSLLLVLWPGFWHLYCVSFCICWLCDWFYPGFWCVSYFGVYPEHYACCVHRPWSC